MDARRRAQLEKAMRARLAALREAGPAKIEPNRTDAAQVGTSDEDAQALSEMLQTLASQQNKKHAVEGQQIAAALARLKQAPDDFGQCEDCGEDIAPGRLEVMPWATLCTECQAKADPKRGQTRRGLTDFK